jgi:hypothetical protein
VVANDGVLEHEKGRAHGKEIEGGVRATHLWAMVSPRRGGEVYRDCDTYGVVVLGNGGGGLTTSNARMTSRPRRSERQLRVAKDPHGFHS